MWQAEVRVDLDAIRHNVARLRAASAPGAGLMAVVKGDGYGHGMVPAARAALDAGADWLGVCTLDEALGLRRAGITAPVLAWLLVPGLALHEGVTADVDLSAATPAGVAELVAAARAAGRPARVHLKVDTGLSRGGATAATWPALVEAAAKGAGDHARGRPPRVRRRGAAGREQRGPGPGGRPGPADRRPGLHGPGRRRLRRRPGRRRRRRGALRPGDARRADRGRLGGRLRHHQLRDRDPDRWRPGAPGLRRQTCRRDAMKGRVKRAGLLGAIVGVAAAGV